MATTYYDNDADLTLIQAKKVAIIGGGVLGLSTAYYCARRGFAVAVAEMFLCLAPGMTTSLVSDV